MAARKREIVPCGEAGQSRGGGTGTGGVGLLIRHGNEQQIAVAVGVGGKRLHGGERGGEPGLHVEQATAGEVVSRPEIGEGALVGLVGMLAGEGVDQGGAQRVGVERERLQRAVAFGLDRIEMAGENQRVGAASAEQQQHGLAGMRSAGDVEDFDGRSGEGRRFAQQLDQPSGEGGFVAGAGDTGDRGQGTRPVFGTFCDRGFSEGVGDRRSSGVWMIDDVILRAAALSEAAVPRCRKRRVPDQSSPGMTAWRFCG